jgi:hypothetical protein
MPRLLTTDLKAIAYVLQRTDIYHKPELQKRFIGQVFGFGIGGHRRRTTSYTTQVSQPCLWYWQVTRLDRNLLRQGERGERVHTLTNMVLANLIDQ